MSRLLVLCLFLLGSVAYAAPTLHHFATSLAEADYNEDTKQLEVGLSMKPSDLEWVLSRREGKRIDLERTADVDALIQSYLNDVFRITGADCEPVPCTWVGKEVETKVTWLYFEFALPDGLEGVELRNRILMRWERDQVNTVNLNHNGDRRTLTFDRRHSTQALTSRTTSAAN